MANLLGIADYVVISAMLLVSASVGLFFRLTGGRQKTTQEFLMAGKDMHIGPVAFSLMATYMSAISTLGVPAETYTYGVQNVLFMVGIPVGAAFCAYFVLPIYFEMEVGTSYEYLEKRFGKTSRTITALLFALQMILYMAVVLYAPSLALNAVTGLSTWASVITLAFVCIFYCSLGGLKAVLWTDVFQACLMYITIIAVVVKIYMVVGFHELNAIALEGGRLSANNFSFDLTERYTVWNTVCGGLLFSFSTFGTNQAQIQRLLSVGDLKKSQHALLLSVPLILCFNLFTFWDGVVIYGLFHDCDPMTDETTHLTSPDQLMPLAIVKLFGSVPGLTGLCIAGVFSASLSTVSSAVNSLTAVTLEDFIRPYCYCRKLSESWMAFVAKLLGVVYGVLTLLITFIVARFRGVLEASNIMFGMVGGPVMGIYALGMFTKRANEPGTLIGLIVGFAINAWLGFGSNLAKPYIQSLPTSLDGCPDLNATDFTVNSTAWYANTTSTWDSQQEIAEEERYIHPAYKISFLWFSFIGFLSVTIVGYVASWILSFCIYVPDVKPETLSTLVRKWHFRCERHSTINKVLYNEVEMQQSQSSVNKSVVNGCSMNESL